MVGNLGSGGGGAAANKSDGERAFDLLTAAASPAEWRKRLDELKAQADRIEAGNAERQRQIEELEHKRLLVAAENDKLADSRAAAETAKADRAAAERAKADAQLIWRDIEGKRADLAQAQRLRDEAASKLARVAQVHRFIEEGE